MKNILLILTLLFISLGLQAQFDPYDEMKTYYDTHNKEKKYEEALLIAKQMNAWALENESDTSLRYANSCKYIGNCFNDLNKTDSAIIYFKKSQRILLGQNRELTEINAVIHRNLGNAYIKLENYEAAIYEYEKTISLYLKICKDEFALHAFIYDNLGILYNEIYDFKKSFENFEKAENLYSQKINPINPIDYANNQINIAVLYNNLGDFVNAKKKFENLEKLLLNPEIPNYGTPQYFKKLSYCMNSFGKLYLRQGKISEAENCFKQVLEIDKELDLNSDNHGWHLINYGDLLRLQKKYDASFNNYMLGLNIFLNNNNYYNTAKAKLYLAHLKSELEQLEYADSLYKSALNIIEDKFGKNSYVFFSAEYEYANLLIKIDKIQEAHVIFKNYFFKKVTEIADNFEWLSDNQKEAYWKKESAFYDNLSWFANESFEKVPEAVGLNYNAALVTKSKMLEAKISSDNYYREVDELREDIAYRRRLLAKMESDGSTEKDKLEKLRQEADSLDKRLTLSWPEYAQQKKNLTITWEQVEQNLINEEAAIEFVRFKNEDDSVVYYNALVLKKGDKNPTLVKLCKEKDLQVISPKMGYSAYYRLVWQPMEAILKDVKTIYYAPTGELYNVPFHAIYAPKGKGDEVLAAKTDKRGVIIQNERAATEQNAEYLMDRYTMHQLTSTRYLAMGLKQKEKETIGNTIAMVGGVNYDYLLGSTTSTKKNNKDKNASRSSTSASGKLNYLEGTKTEVEQINQQVTAATWQTKLIENNEATEENITKMEGKEAKGILHLATHGYAFPEYDFKDTSISKSSLRYSYRYSTNPMVRSGLILAGGNWAWTGSDTLTKLGAEQNGILTALEVSQLNLKKTKLVVLSACETGLGKIEGSEGTFGLKRGFKLAGVEQMIVSLWSVPDKETMELMTLFYTDLTKSLNPVISFEKAQKEMRNRYPTEPEKWAGFVLVR